MPITSTTLALSPVVFVATDPPSAQIGTDVVLALSPSINALSASPRIHFGTITGCNHTLSSPTFSSSLFVHVTALSAPRLPLNLDPI